MKQLSNKRKKNKSFQHLTTIICLCIFCFSLYQLTKIYFEYRGNSQALAEIQEIYLPETEMQEQNKEQVVRQSFQPLLEINQEIVGWITIDQTKIDYPILQAENNEYYLDRNYRHEKTRAGSLFMDYRNDVQGSDKHTIIYGHRMKDGSMFGQISKFLDQSFLDEHPSFYFDTLYEGYEAEIFSVYETTTDFYYIETDFSDDQVYQSFIDEIKNRSVVQTNIDVGMDDQIITLSTCDNWRSNGRLVMHAKLSKTS
ncbi:class B sortase [Bacillus sp. FJAT-50079]|uniref:class B sortase n=1 Tax=Bacillus sp. FJAT-50079 TaxID=2833577 RepID=UPI001BC93785|nr:class B sortase [Bacillus sp. FJAT-50079]MBS4210033.1 class B sortase [Bacillus sp. FJAT-50079]